jgi:hypothetical protein
MNNAGPQDATSPSLFQWKMIEKGRAPWETPDEKLAYWMKLSSASSGSFLSKPEHLCPLLPHQHEAHRAVLPLHSRALSRWGRVRTPPGTSAPDIRVAAAPSTITEPGAREIAHGEAIQSTWSSGNAASPAKSPGPIASPAGPQGSPATHCPSRKRERGMGETLRATL